MLYMFMFCGSCERENEGFVKYFWLSGEEQSKLSIWDSIAIISIIRRNFLLAVQFDEHQHI